MREGMSQQERERREKLEAIGNQLRMYYPSDVQRKSPKNPPAQPKEKKEESLIDEALNILPERISAFIFFAILVPISIIGGITIACLNETGHSLWWAIPLGIFGGFFFTMITYVLFCVIVLWPIYKIFTFFKDKAKSSKNLSKPIGNRLCLTWNRMEEGVGCIMARKERLVLVIILVAIVLAILLYLFPIPRYTSKVMHTGRGIVYQHDRWTGKSYIIYLDGSRRQVQD